MPAHRQLQDRLSRAHPRYHGIHCRYFGVATRFTDSKTILAAMQGVLEMRLSLTRVLATIDISVVLPPPFPDALR